ncbi:NAD-dependent epimerase/dehydratase family protein [Bacteroides thetaiotaomicron]|uniref:NAD-dependent epimerase/dehydratase family protein n=1 Tax=Bacteroides thetaiotaomicron TaxID=818 RepID=UPI0021669329|nr:NAD-dependent epimerase/dehydratase family protein [Bacteroides thetaiotaomicron]MCS2449200.1 NAD-dependent epimerase/dehydratase family protein [Bacteroides thetaiotaomicron]
MKIAIIGGSGFVGSRLISLLRTLPDIELLNIDKRQSSLCPDLTQVADVLDIRKLTELLAGVDLVVLLAAEHKDNVTPTSLYYTVNVEGMRNTLQAMESNGVTRLVFTSSVAVYGLNKNNPSELHPADPFNDYGRSKWQAECMLQKWHDTHRDWNINILRPAVIFGEGNRGNVYNLLRQITSGRFLMVGDGENRKSMAYVGNVASFISFLIEDKKEGYNVFNYIDKPDFTMNDLVYHVGDVLNKHIPATHYPYWLGMFGGYCFDALAKITGRKLSVSSVRVKKFCAVTQFDSNKVQASGFKPAFTMEEGLTRTLQYEFGSGVKKVLN